MRLPCFQLVRWLQARTLISRVSLTSLVHCRGLECAASNYLIRFAYCSSSCHKALKVKCCDARIANCELGSLFLNSLHRAVKLQFFGPKSKQYALNIWKPSYFLGKIGLNNLLNFSFYFTLTFLHHQINIHGNFLKAHSLITLLRHFPLRELSDGKARP